MVCITYKHNSLLLNYAILISREVKVVDKNGMTKMTIIKGMPLISQSVDPCECIGGLQLCIIQNRWVVLQRIIYYVGCCRINGNVWEVRHKLRVQLGG